jgi:hypothetical protein
MVENIVSLFRVWLSFGIVRSILVVSWFRCLGATSMGRVDGRCWLKEHGSGLVDMWRKRKEGKSPAG